MTFNISLTIISDGSYAVPHASRVVGGEMTLNFRGYSAFALLIPAFRFLLAAHNGPASPDLKAESNAFRRHCTSPFSQGFWLGWMVTLLGVVASAICLLM